MRVGGGGAAFHAPAGRRLGGVGGPGEEGVSFPQVHSFASGWGSVDPSRVATISRLPRHRLASLSDASLEGS